jgi:hypothetical protein
VLKTGILNPHLCSLLSRVRHTITLVIVDRCFPFWSRMEIVDPFACGWRTRAFASSRGHADELRHWPGFMVEEFSQNNAEEKIRTCERRREHPDYARALN